MQNRRRRGQVTIAYLLMAAVAALLVVVLAVRQITRATTTEVWTAKKPLIAGQKIEAAHLVSRRVARNEVPQGAITNMQTLVGRVLKVPVAQGAPLTAQEFQAAGPKVWLSDAPEPGRSVMAVRLGGAVVPVQSFRHNDRLDIYAVLKDGSTRIVARDARYLGSLKSAPAARSNNALADLVGSATSRRRGNGGGPVALVLSLRQQDLDAVAAAQNGRLAFALHGVNEPPYVPVAALPPAVEPTVDLIMGKTREKVNVIQ